ncbi:MAG: RluA family pseudouridine synthase [Opitutaceae bacterium]|nr:RluA family pseudouridine synthase [Opitutaceae bacterium]
MTTTYIVLPGVRRARADKILSSAFSEYSRMAFQRAFDAGLVQAGGKPITRDHLVSAGDVLEFTFPRLKPNEFKGVAIPIEVIFEDKHLLAVNKTAGMVVHPGAATGEDTLVHALLAHCRGGLSGIGGVERPGIVHRLDRETSGIILVAKTDAAHRGLAKQFAERSLQKDYLALVTGALELLSGSIRKAIGRNKQHRHKMAAVEEGQGGRDAHTDWEVEERFGGFATLVRCAIHTGRTHQIRVHMKSLGHLVLGDVIYGWKRDPRLTRQPERVMLHASHLIFAHPISGRVIDLRAPLPADFEAQLTQLRKVSKMAAEAERLRFTPVRPRRSTVPPPYHAHESRK